MNVYFLPGGSPDPEAAADVWTAGWSLLFVAAAVQTESEFCWVMRGSSAACEEEQVLTTSAVNLIIDRGRHGDSRTVTHSELSHYK